jgi:beta-lactamase superfamily II metal-dependent hydrolase
VRIPLGKLSYLALLLCVQTSWGANRHLLTVHFFDVGQGDSALIVSPTGKTVLVDGGPPEAAESLTARVTQLVHKPIDLVILTHPHLDHVGGLLPVLQKLGARRYMDPGFPHPSAAYESLLHFVQQNVPEFAPPDVDPEHPERNLKIAIGGGATLTILWPRRPEEAFFRETRSDVNANSIVMRLSYGKMAFLLAADAEQETEERLLKKPRELRADVLKVAHHGSRYSSSARFLAAVRPSIAIVSVGVGNDYGHPTQEALTRIQDVGAQLFRTDVNGEILVTSDGRTVSAQIVPRRLCPPTKSGSQLYSHSDRCLP